MFQVKNRNIRTRCKICSNLTIKTPEQRHRRHRHVIAGWISLTYRLAMHANQVPKKQEHAVKFPIAYIITVC